MNATAEIRVRAASSLRRAAPFKKFQIKIRAVPFQAIRNSAALFQKNMFLCANDIYHQSMSHEYD